MPKNSQKDVSEYLKSLNLTIRAKYTESEVISFDETSIYADMFDNYTYDKRGKTKVSAVTSGHEKVRLSCLMASSMDGKKDFALVSCCSAK